MRIQIEMVSLALLAALAGAGNVAAQVRWRQREPAVPPARHAHALAYEGARQRALLFGGVTDGGVSPVYRADTWEWDGEVWTNRSPALHPGERAGHAMVFLAGSGRALLFGGRDSGGARGDTWEWDGGGWSERHPAHAPPARCGHALACDSARGRVVLFGGEDGGGAPLGDTWEWDGTDWSPRSQSGPAPGPGYRMVFDAARGRALLFGGAGGQTWTWDGASWTRLSPALAPPERSDHALAYDGGRRAVVLFGGISPASGLELGDLWEWDGARWAPRQPASGPGARAGAAMVYDQAAQRVLLFGGSSSGGALERADTWEWNGLAWEQRSQAMAPGLLCQPSLACDSARHRAVLFRGCGETWEWDGLRWERKRVAAGPPPRQGQALVYDEARGRTLLFGGYGAAQGYLADTWEWDGIAWIQHSPASSPPARTNHALAYDAARQRVVLFGGRQSGGLAGDTWEWDGTSWTQRQPALSPPAREGAALAYDAARGRVVLFGGQQSSGLMGDTWEWNGTSWSQRQPGVSPQARAFHALAYDAHRGLVVLFGGRLSCSSFSSETWEWNGSTWSRRATSLRPPAREGAAMAYFPAHRVTLLFGGYELLAPGCLVSELADLWAHGLLVPAATSLVGAGCAGTSGVPRLSAFGDPVLGNQRFRLEITSARPLAAGALLLARRVWVLPLGGGCTLFLDLPSLLSAPAFASGPVGSASVPLPVPLDPVLMGGVLQTQAAVLDPSGPIGLTLTNGLRVGVGE